MGEVSTFFKRAVLDGPKRSGRKGKRAYQDARAVVRGRSKGWCEIRVPRVCEGRAVEFHHKLMRSQGGPDTPENLAHACTACHMYVHRNTGWAYKVGWLIRSFAAGRSA